MSVKRKNPLEQWMVGPAAKIANSSVETPTVSKAKPAKVDFADFLNSRGSLSDEDKLKLVETDIPRSKKNLVANLKKRKCQLDWFQKYPFLRYSDSLHSILCIPCFLFSSDYGQLISLPFDDWGNFGDRILKHSQCKEHRGAVGNVKQLQAKVDIRVGINTGYMEEQRKNLKEKNLASISHPLSADEPSDTKEK